MMELPGGRVVALGTPITSEQAAFAVLRMIQSDLVGDVDRHRSAGVALAEIDESGCYRALSAGEQRLVDIATAIWAPHSSSGARVSALGGLDLDRRRQVLVILAYLFLGRTSLDALEAEEAEFGDMFGADDDLVGGDEEQLYPAWMEDDALERKRGLVDDD